MELSEAAKQARLKYQREWRAKHPDYDKKWREENKERVLLSQREWRERNPEYFKRTQKERTEYLKAYLKNNPDKRKQYEATKWENKARQDDTLKDNSVTVSVTPEPGQSVCKQCGSFFQPKRSTGKYCSDKCRVKYNRSIAI